MVWTSITAVIFIGLAVLGAARLGAAPLASPPPGAYRVLVTAQQFQWNFHYPGPDKTFGRTDPKLINDESMNYTGLDQADAAAEDDTVTQTAVVQRTARSS